MMPTHCGRQPPHVEIAVVKEEHGHVFFQTTAIRSLPRSIFDQSYRPVERDEPMGSGRTEPFFIRQTGAIVDKIEERAWIEGTIRQCREEGGQWMRVSIDRPTGALLVEGWHRRPEDEGPLRFAIERGSE